MDQKLRSWCKHQRDLYKTNSLNDSKIIKLESIEGWSWYNDLDVQWYDRYNELKVYVEEHGELPKKNRNTKNSMCNWIDTQKITQKNGSIPTYRIALLEALNGWEWYKCKDQYWDWKFKALVEYVETHKKLPSQKVETLGSWVDNLRIKYRNGKLFKSEILALESITEWYWDYGYVDFFDKVESLKKYISENKCLPKRSNKEFGLWISNQRKKYHKDDLPQDRIDALESISEWVWIVHADRLIKSFDERFNEFKQYIEINGIIPNTADKEFGKWINCQRVSYERRTLPQYRIDALNSIDGWSWRIDHNVSWWNIANNLKEYICDGNTIETPIKNNKEFGQWIISQRSNYRSNKLSIDKIQFLESINGWAWGKNS